MGEEGGGVVMYVCETMVCEEYYSILGHFNMNAWMMCGAKLLSIALLFSVTTIDEVGVSGIRGK